MFLLLPRRCLVALSEADALYNSLLALDRTLVQRAKEAWFAMHPKSLQESFVQDFIPKMLPDLIRAQTAAAAMGAKNITRGVDAAAPSVLSLPPLPDVVPSGFAGVAADGRPLSSLLAQPLIETYVNLDHGMPMDLALRSGFDSMDQILATQVQDAARTAQSVQMVVHRVTYYIRHTEPGACDRCLVLEGAHFKTNKGFLRHPHCRCLHVPGVSEYLDPVDGSRGVKMDSGPPTQSPRDLFDAMSRADQDKTFGVAGAQAIRQGASMSSVVNARRGMSTASGTTTEGTDRRGSFTVLQREIAKQQGGRRAVTAPRLMPEQIYKIAKGDSAEELRLLLGNGYITEGSFTQRASRYIAMSRRSSPVDLTR